MCVYTMKGKCQLMICRGHIRVSKGALQKFSMVNGYV